MSIDNKRARLQFLLMAQMNLSIPDKLKSWVETQVSGGDYASSSDYVRDLLRRDQRLQEARASLQAEIDVGRASGLSERSVSDIIAAAKAVRDAGASAA